jgi:hypothetical protein
MGDGRCRAGCSEVFRQRHAWKGGDMLEHCCWSAEGMKVVRMPLDDGKASAAPRFREGRLVSTVPGPASRVAMPVFPRLPGDLPHISGNRPQSLSRVSRALAVLPFRGEPRAFEVAGPYVNSQRALETLSCDFASRARNASPCQTACALSKSTARYRNSAALPRSLNVFVSMGNPSALWKWKARYVSPPNVIANASGCIAHPRV